MVLLIISKMCVTAAIPQANLSVNGPTAVEIDVVQGLIAVSLFSGNAAVNIEIWLRKQ